MSPTGVFFVTVLPQFISVGDAPAQLALMLLAYEGMVIAWLITLPAAAIVGAAMWWIGHLIGGLPGALVIFVLLLIAASYMYLRARRTPINEHNVNDEWQGATPVSPAPTPASVR